MTRGQKAKQTKKQIKEMLAHWQEDVLKNVDSVLASGMAPDYMIQADDYLLAKAVLFGSMEQKPYSPPDPRLRKDFENIALAC